MGLHNDDVPRSGPLIVIFIKGELSSRIRYYGFTSCPTAGGSACPPPALAERSRSILFLERGRLRNEGAMSIGDPCPRGVRKFGLILELARSRSDGSDAKNSRAGAVWPAMQDYIHYTDSVLEEHTNEDSQPKAKTCPREFLACPRAVSPGAGIRCKRGLGGF